MKIGILKETSDKRVAIVPDLVKKWTEQKFEVLFENGCGEQSNFSDDQYQQAGGSGHKREEILSNADILIVIKPLEDKETSKIKKGCLVISNFQPFFKTDLIEDIAKKELSALSLDMIPRITIAQSMDVLSSMASIAGYKAVIMAADHLARYFPMLTTAAGSIPPAKVLIIGAGVAGLQAVATARRLGAVVEAFDTRLAAKEEVESLGAKFVEVEGAKDDSSAGGYAVEQTEEYKQRQKELIFEKCVKADVIITTAQLRGKPAPKLVTKEMVKEMKPGSVIVDLASSTGGNCELTEDNKTIVHDDVVIIGNSDLASEVPQHASQLYSKNIENYTKVFLKEGEYELDLENEIVKSSCMVKEGNLLYQKQ